MRNLSDKTCCTLEDFLVKSTNLRLLVTKSSSVVLLVVWNGRLVVRRKQAGAHPNGETFALTTVTFPHVATITAAETGRIEVETFKQSVYEAWIAHWLKEVPNDAIIYIVPLPDDLAEQPQAVSQLNLVVQTTHVAKAHATFAQYSRHSR